MKCIVIAILAISFGSGVANAHPGLLEHLHPHEDAASYFTIETLIIFAIGLSIGGTLAWYRRRKNDGK